ncbi:SEC-C domain-containing protein [Myxococcota bacterium]|nr:SEC-C domain-containing protein [Myxococcota bacterium]
MSARTDDAPGRNDPCPCGSGKKYKKCCLLAAEAAPRYTSDDEKAFREWVGDLPEADEVALTLFADLPDDLYDREVAGPIAEAWLTLHLACDVHGDPTHPLSAQLREHVEAHEFAPGVSAYLRAVADAVPRPYKVVEIHRGNGATVVDLIDERERRLYHPPFGDPDFMGETIIARVVPRGPSGQAEPLLPWMPFPRPEDDEENWFIDEFLEDLRLFRELNPGVPDAVFLRQQPPGLMRAWYQAVYGVPVEDLQTPDGHPVEDIDVVFEVQDPDALRTTLDARPDLAPVGDDWEWRQTVPGSGDETTALAWLRLEGDRLLVQCIARPHAEHLREVFGALPGLTFLEMVGTETDHPGGDDPDDEA